MFTVCPKCALTLAVTAADLRAGQGYVRCGRCGNVFNALLALSEEAGTPRRGAGAPGDTAPAPTPAPPSRRPLPIGQPSIAHWEPEPAAGAMAERAWSSTGTRRHLQSSIPRQPPDRAPAIRRHRGIPRQRHLRDHRARGRRLHCRPRRRSRRGRVELPTIATHRGHDRAEQIAAATIDGDDRAAETARRPRCRRPVRIDAPATELEPSAALREPRRFRTRRTWSDRSPTRGLVLAGLGACARLLACCSRCQAVHHWRNDLASRRRWYRPADAAATPLLGVPLTPHWDLNAYDVRQLGADSRTAPTARITRAPVGA